MAFIDDFRTLMQGIGSDLSDLGKELRGISEDAAKEFLDDPAKYVTDSAREFANLSIEPRASFATIGSQSHDCPDTVAAPVEGSILYTELLFSYAEHSGVYLGNNQIVELNRRGEIQVVSPVGFTSSGTGNRIYVSCRGKKAIGSKMVAERASRMVGRMRNYNIVLNNCHQFTSRCLNNDFENSDNFLWMLKSSAQNSLFADNWRIWESQ